MIAQKDQGFADIETLETNATQTVPLSLDIGKKSGTR